MESRPPPLLVIIKVRSTKLSITALPNSIGFSFVAISGLNFELPPPPLHPPNINANDCIKTAIDHSQKAGMIPKRFMKGMRYPGEAAAYSVRELGLSAEILWLWKCRSDVPYWQIADCVAAHAGHAVNWATYMNKDCTQEFNLQRQSLIDLLLSWSSEEWQEDYYSPFKAG